LPAPTATRINVLATVDWMHESDQELSAATSQDRDVLPYYFEDHLFFDYRAERTRIQVVVPIRFDAQSRTPKSLLPQPDLASYKSVSRLPPQAFGSFWTETKLEMLKDTRGTRMLQWITTLTPRSGPTPTPGYSSKDDPGCGNDRKSVR
jgi:hypothetical protein